MPLVGTICCKTGKPTPFETCLTASLRGRPYSCDHPFALIAFMATKDKGRHGVGISASNLTGCARKIVLQRDHDFYEHPKNMWNLFRGALGHEMVGRYADQVPDGLMEQRLVKAFDVPSDEADGETYRIDLSGQPDWVVPDYGDRYQGMVEDFKSTLRSVLAITQAKIDHIEQVTFYAELLNGGEKWMSSERVNVPVEIGRITYFDMTGSKTVEFGIEQDPGERQALIIERLRPYVREQITGQLPDLLPSRIVKSKRTQATQVHRHPLCSYCSVRTICDRLYEEGK